MNKIQISHNRYRPNKQYVEDKLNAVFSDVDFKIRKVSLNSNPRVIAVTVGGKPLWQSWTKGFEVLLDGLNPKVQSKRIAVDHAIQSIVDESLVFLIKKSKKF